MYLIVIAGVSGSGKSTVGGALAAKLNTPFIDGDSLHSPENVAKMASGRPLTDEDRWPWLRLIGAALRDHHDTGLVVACSSLRRAYRDMIRSIEPTTHFITLSGSRALLEERLRIRPGHFMPPALLDSQLAAFEALQPDEGGTDLDFGDTVESIVETAVRVIRGGNGVSPTLPRQ